MAQLLQFFINLGMGKTTVLGLGTGGAFSTMMILIIVAVSLAEFFGRAFESACPDKKAKRFNFETSTYDSEKNGRLSYAAADKTHASINDKTFNLSEYKNAENDAKMQNISKISSRDVKNAENDTDGGK